MGEFVKRFKEKVLRLYFLRNRIPFLDFPIPWRLPYGAWFLVYPDEMGLNIILRKQKLSYEENEWKVLSKLIKPGMICFDVGANQGFYTLFLSKAVGAGGTVFAFEPVPEELKKMKRNIAINRCRNIVLEGNALGSYSGTANLFACLDGHGSRSSMRPPPREVNARIEKISIPINTLEYYVRSKGIRQVDFIKIDVEGAEKEVLEGSREILKEFRPFVIIEMADVTTKQFNYPAVENYDFLKSEGFSLFEIIRGGDLKPSLPKDQYRENLVAFPNEKLGLISDLLGVA